MEKVHTGYLSRVCTDQNFISWLSLGLFSGGILVRQILGIPMWQSTIVLVAFSGLFTYMGGLKAIAKVNVFQMILLIVVSLST
jgi:solute:Na+ symporter, SSS family